MYKVIYPFADLQDNCYMYAVGDIFPHEGLKVTKARLAELASKENAIGKPLIILIEEAPKKKAAKKSTKKAADK